MTKERLLALLERITYKPDWHFKLAELTDGGWLLQAAFEAPDADNPDAGVTEQHGYKRYISTHAADNEVISAAFALILAAEEHEVRETFKLDGNQVFGPHGDWLALSAAMTLGALTPVGRTEVAEPATV